MRSWRISSFRLSIPSAIVVSARARSCRVLRGQGPSSKARRAAAIARRMSSAVASGAVPMISSVAGFGIA